MGNTSENGRHNGTHDRRTIEEVVTEYGGGALLDQGEIARHRKTRVTTLVQDNSPVQMGRLANAIHHITVFEKLGESTQRDIEEGKVRVLIDIDGHRLDIPLSNNGAHTNGTAK